EIFLHVPVADHSPGVSACGKAYADRSSGVGEEPVTAGETHVDLIVRAGSDVGVVIVGKDKRTKVIGFGASSNSERGLAGGAGDAAEHDAIRGGDGVQQAAADERAVGSGLDAIGLTANNRCRAPAVGIVSAASDRGIGRPGPDRVCVSANDGGKGRVSL